MPVSAPAQQSIVLEGIQWETYERILDDLDGRRLRLSYDRGTLEIMTISGQHEWFKILVRRMVEALTEELGVPIRGGGSTTWKRRDLERGLEPDECYWVQNEHVVRDKFEVDLLVDPPPDLALEIDVHASSVSRMGIYGALGVPEVWRHTDAGLSVFLRDAAGEYAVSDRSRAFPRLPLGALPGWIERRRGQDETSWIRAFRAWVRGTVAP